MDARPFNIQIPNEQLEDLQDRLHATRWPVPLIETGWNDGADLPFMERLTDYWRDRFDWRAQEADTKRGDLLVTMAGGNGEGLLTRLRLCAREFANRSNR